MNIYIDDKTVFDEANWSLLSHVLFTDITDCDTICVGIDKVIDDKFIENAKNARYILCPSTGIDHIKTKKLKIINIIPSEASHITASSEFTLLLILSILRKAHIAMSGNKIIGQDISGKTVGLIGYGRIAKNIEPCLKNLGAKTIWHDNKLASRTKKEVLEQSDIVVLLINATEENRDFFSWQEFDLMKTGSFFINVTRGFVVNEEALLNALQSKKIAGAALDVVNESSILCKYNGDNLIITPHVAGSTTQSRKKACDFVLKKLSDLHNEDEFLAERRICGTFVPEECQKK